MEFSAPQPSPLTFGDAQNSCITAAEAFRNLEARIANLEHLYLQLMHKLELAETRGFTNSETVLWPTLGIDPAGTVHTMGHDFFNLDDWVDGLVGDSNGATE